MHLKHKYIYPLIWFVLICYASFTPSDNVPKLTFFPQFDKLVHIGIYFVLSILLIPAFLKYKKYSQAYIYVLITCISIGSTFEFLQMELTTSRSASLYDAIANITGALLGILIYNILIKNKKIEKNIFRIE